MGRRADGSSWAIATPHTAASEAGAAAFERGGNALDAALAAAMTLAVVYPHMCGVGGDLFALVQLPEGRVFAVNASGRAPLGVDAATLRASHRTMPDRGPASVTVPGAVDGWSILHRLGARLPWEEAFDRAIDHAYNGMAVAPSLAERLALASADLVRDPGLASVFFGEGPGATATATGDRIAQPALGATLQAIAGGGLETFYRGELGRRFASGLRDLGVPIADEDLSGHTSDVLPPLATRYRDLHVSVVPPNSQGFVLLELLSLVERLGIDPDPNGADAGTLGLAIDAVGVDREMHLADAGAMRVHPHALLDEGHLADVAQGIRDGVDRASALPIGVSGSPHGIGDTVALVTADAEGHAVSLIQSLFRGFGAGLLEPTTGIVAQSRGGCFTLEPGHPNELAPGKRPAHTLMPVLVHRNGALAAAAGTMGGYAQPQIVASALMRAFDLGMHPGDAVSDPRWLASGTDATQPGPRHAIVEPDLPATTQSSLGAAGFRLDDVEHPGGTTGHAHLIRVDGSTLAAGSDPRADGSAIAV